MSSRSTLPKAKVIFDFYPDFEGGLEAKAGDIVEILLKQEDGWSKCSLNNVIGYLPTNYLEMISLPPAPPVPLSRPSMQSGNRSKSHSRESSKSYSAYPQLDDYMCSKLIGEGGFGKVYLGMNVAENQERVALKLTKCEGEAEFNRNLREALNIAKLSHDYIVPIEDAFKYTDENGETFICIVMPFYAFGSLDKQIFGREDMIPESIIMDVLSQMSSALAYIHGKKMIHRDIKPHNILIQEMTDTSIKTVLSDFGLSRNISIQMSMSHSGTLVYMSPEMRRLEKFDEKADIWALGCVIYQMMTRKLTDMYTYILEIQSQQLSWKETLVKNTKGYSPKLVDLVFKMLTNDPKQRISAQEIQQALSGTPIQQPFLSPEGHLSQKIQQLSIQQKPVTPLYQPKLEKITFPPNTDVWVPINRESYAIENNFTARRSSMGALDWNKSSIIVNKTFSSTIGGKYYMEFEITDLNPLNNTKFMIGVTSDPKGSIYNNDIVIGMGGNKYNVSGTEDIFGNKGDKIGILLDMDSCILKFYKNGKPTDNYASLRRGTDYNPVAHIYSISDAVTATFPSGEHIYFIDSFQHLKFYQDLIDSYFVKKYFPFYIQEQVLNPKDKYPFNISADNKTITKVGGGNQWTDAQIFIPRKFKISPGQGKAYWEVIIENINRDKTGLVIGVTKDFASSYFNTDIGIGMSGIKYGGVTGSAKLEADNGDRIGLLLNCEDGSLSFFKNGKMLDLSATLPVGTIVYPVIHMFYIGDKITVDFTTIKKAKEELSRIEGMIPYSGILSPLCPDNFRVHNQTVKKESGGYQWNDAPVFIDTCLNHQSGKVFWEVRIDNIHKDRSGMFIGITKDKQSSYYKTDIGINMKGSAYGMTGNGKFFAHEGDRIGVLIDFDNLEIHFYKNGRHTEISGSISRNVNYYPVIHLYNIDDQVTVTYPSVVTSLTPLCRSFAIEERTLVPTHPNCFTMNKFTIKKDKGSKSWSDAKVIIDKKLNYSSGRLYWEVCINNINQDRTGMVIGLTSTKEASNFKEDIAIGMSCLKYGGVTGDDDWKAKKDDRIGVLIDFDKRSVEFYLNHVQTTLKGSIKKGVNYWPVVHLYYNTDEVTITFPSAP